MTEKELTDLIDSRANVIAEQKAAEIVAAKNVEVQAKYKELHDASLMAADRKGRQAVPDTIMFGRFARAATIAKGNPEMAAGMVEKLWPNFGGVEVLKGYFDITAKAQTVTVPSEGGITVPEILSDRVIDVLYAQTAVQQAGVTKLPMANGNLTVSRMDSGALVSYFGETKKVTKTQDVFGAAKLSGKKLGALVPISRDLIRSNAVAVDAWIVRDLQRKFMLRMDRAILYGLGSSYEPAGLDNTIISSAKIGSTSTVFTSDTPLQLISVIDAADAPPDGRAWIMHPYMKNYIMNLKATTGQFIYRDEMARGVLFGYPVLSTTQSGYTNTGTYNTSSADIWLGSWPEFIWADQMTIEITTSTEASYDDGSGTFQSAFQQDQQLIRAIGVHDFNVFHNVSFVKSTNKFSTT